MRVDIAELRLKKEKLCEHVVNSPDRLNAEKGRDVERIRGLKVDLAEKEDRMNKMHRKKADLIHMLEIAGKCRQDILAVECNNRSQTWVYFCRLLWPMADRRSWIIWTYQCSDRCLSVKWLYSCVVLLFCFCISWLYEIFGVYFRLL